MNVQKVEENVEKVSIPTSFDPDFIYELLAAYGKPKASITLLKGGKYNLSKDPNEILWKKNLFFSYVEHHDLHSTIDDLRGDKDVLRHEPRFIIVTDFNQLLAVDTKTQETLDIKIQDLSKHYTFFLPWAGMEKASSKSENLADVKAAARMAKLYDEIRKENPSLEPEFIHSLNVFFSRLLFCFFAEDTDVFNKGQFTGGIASHTQVDGSDLNEYLDRLFESLDKEDKSEYPNHIQSFPYVNGGLFGKKLSCPVFSPQARRILLECGELNWSQINPDIFGSMIQAVVHPSQREILGMHYTSVVNIMKVIEPLFLEKLNEEFDKAYDDEKKLMKLLNHVYSIKVFDPACGSGNFLIIAYKELRRLEHKVLERLMERKLKLKLSSGIKLENFYGIEIDDFAHEIAILSLWLVKHQMNQEFKELFNVSIPLVPLKDAGNIACANAATIDWEEVCSHRSDEEVYVIGNPPYLGSTMQDTQQKNELAMNCKGFANYKNLDYIAIWFIKASHYINGSAAQAAFVSTNSICQGEQVSLLWPHILSQGLEIGFAHQSFKWTNNARNNAGVICVITGLRVKSSSPKYIFNKYGKITVKNISPYLIDSPDVIVRPRSKQISELPEMSYGNKPVDGGNLILTLEEKKQLLERTTLAKNYMKRLYGSREFLNDIERWCLWISNSEKEQALKIPEIKERVEKTKKMRLESKDIGAQMMANRPHQFREMKISKSQALIIPRVSSERREYIPIGYLNSEAVIIDSAQAVYDAAPYVFGLISSRMHMVWVRAVSGRLKSDYRYSSALAYNTFPAPRLSDKQREIITTHTFEILSARESHPEKTLSELYDPDKMPADLHQAHQDLDEVVDHCYRAKPFESDEERLSYLFKLYEEMTANKQERIHA